MKQVNAAVNEIVNFVLNSWQRWLTAMLVGIMAMATTTILMNPLRVLEFKTSEPLGITHLIIAVIVIWTLQQTLWQVASDMLKVRLGAAWQLGLTGVIFTAMSNYATGGDMKLPLGFSVLAAFTLFFCVVVDNMHSIMGNDVEVKAYPLEDEPQEKAKNDLLLHEDTTHEVIYHEPRQRSYSK